MLVLLSLALFPLGLALAWAARVGIQTAQSAVVDESIDDGKIAARMVDALIARNALALRIAANGAMRTDRASPCPAIAQSLALTPAIAARFVVRGDDGQPVCVHGSFVAGINTDIVAPGAMSAWIHPTGQSIQYRVGVNGGMATGELTAAELDRAVADSGSATVAISVRDKAETLVIRATPDQIASTRVANYPIVGDQLTAMVRTRLAEPGMFARLAIFLPLLMWGVAALLSWMLVRRLLLVPLARLERAVSDYQPGEGALVVPERLGAASEIRSLGSAFERAVDRLESSDQQKDEAIQGQRRLVREVHHRVKNNLQVIASLLNIHGRSATTPESRAAYAAIGRRVDALSVVHRNHFAEVEESRGIALRPLLTELGQILGASAPDTAAGTSIQLDADAVHTTQDAAVAVAFFVTELIEFAMLQGTAQPIEIELRRTSELAASLTVSSDALVPDGEEPAIERHQFERVIAGLARQLRSPLEQKLGRLSVTLPVFPD